MGASHQHLSARLPCVMHLIEAASEAFTPVGHHIEAGPSQSNQRMSATHQHLFSQYRSDISWNERTRVSDVMAS